MYLFFSFDQFLRFNIVFLCIFIGFDDFIDRIWSWSDSWHVIYELNLAANIGHDLAILWESTVLIWYRYKKIKAIVKQFGHFVP